VALRGGMMTGPIIFLEKPAVPKIGAAFRFDDCAVAARFDRADAPAATRKPHDAWYVFGHDTSPHPRFLQNHIPRSLVSS
jgi:hypothetical protein